MTIPSIHPPQGATPAVAGPGPTRIVVGADASEKTLLVLEVALSHPRSTDVVEATGFAEATPHRILPTIGERQLLSLAADGSCLPGPGDAGTVRRTPGWFAR